MAYSSQLLIDGLHRNAERLARILTDLLDLSRLDAGQYRVDPVDVDVRGVAEQAIAALERTAGDRQVAVTLAVGAGRVVRADPKALDQVLVSLIDNAIKYSTTGGHAWVEAQPRGDRIRIEIRDDGPCIAPRHRDRIFERFYRVDPGRSRGSAAPASASRSSSTWSRAWAASSASTATSRAAAPSGSRCPGRRRATAARACAAAAARSSR